MITAVDVPQDALLQRYVQRDGCYTDCFEVTLPRQIDLAGFIAAFYKTPLFRLERWVLTLGLRRWISDADVDALAMAQSERFAAWSVEARAADQILLCDLGGKTRSYLSVASGDGGTVLRFGSAVVPEGDGSGLGRVVTLLMPAHRLYSRLLLAAAARRLRQ